MAAEAKLEEAGNEDYRDRHMEKMFEDGFSYSGYERDGLYLNLGTGKFLNISGISGIDSITDGRGAVFADFDNDGDMDVFLTTIQGQGDLLFRNNVGQENGFIRVTLEGTESGKDAYSAIVRVKTSAGVLTKLKAGGSGYISQHDSRLLFGLGSDTKADWIEVIWPSGLKQRFEDIAAGISLKIVEGRANYEILKENRFELAAPSSVARKSLSALRVKQDSQIPDPELPSLEDRKSVIKVPLGYYPLAKRLTSVGTNPCVGGGKIAFAAHVDGNYEIYTANTDGSNVTRLTNNNTNDYSPALSPDGKRIAFISFTLDGQNNDEIFIMDSDGGNQIRLTENTVSDGGPTFSPDGKRIAFESDRGDDRDIYIMDSDSGNGKRLVRRDGIDSCAAFSPDGRSIVFASYTDAANGVKSDIYLVDLDSGEQKQLTDDEFMNSNPSFSPDGRLIVFESNRDGNSEIYLMEVDGGKQTRLTNNTFMDIEPVFLSDGHRIIFVAHRSAMDQLGIFVMDLLKQE